MKSNGHDATDSGGKENNLSNVKSSDGKKTPTSLTERVRLLLGGESPVHPLFIQLDVLVHFDGRRSGWKEIARWVKYEETVEIGDRWSKPHVPTAQLHALTELRKAVVEKRCITGLGVPAPKEGAQNLADILSSVLQADGRLSDSVRRRITETLVLPHKHKHRTTLGGRKGPVENVQYIPADNKDDNENMVPGDVATYVNEERKKIRKQLLRRRSGDGKDISMVYHKYPQGAKPDNLTPHQPNLHLTKKLPKESESASMLVGQVDFLEETLMVFCRLEKESILADLTEVDAPVRFLFIILGPTKDTNIWEFQEMGRAMAALLSDKIFCGVAYNARTVEDIVDGMDEFIDDLTVLPPSIWDPSVRIEPPRQTRSMDKIMLRLDEYKRQASGPTAAEQEEGASDDPSLQRTGKVFGGLVQDIKHRYKFYLSDFRDGLHIQCVASTIFLFFACITPIVTFGGLMGQKTDGYVGTMETLMSGAVCGVLYAAFAGQPLTIVGATGPLLIFESILYYLCKENGLDFMSFRFWVGFWVAVALLIIVAFDLSALVRYITRFTEESFTILISVIFIYEAFTKIAEIYAENRVHTGVIREEKGFLCFCQPSEFPPKLNETLSMTSDVGNESIQRNWTDEFPEECTTYQKRFIVRTGCVSESSCLDHGWNLTGPACSANQVTHSVADVFFISIILFFGTFVLAMFFRTMRNSRFFPSRIRATFADFAVFLSVVSFTSVDFVFGLNTPKLNVPEQFVPTRSDRGWLVNPGNITYWWLIPLSFLPAVLATILVFLDQQITSVIVNRKEHKLKKGHGYHLDLFVLAFLIVLCSFLGLPWFVAATVRAITHVKSLFRESEVSVPGERTQIIGVREQRVTGICIHLLIGFSTLLTSILRLIPMPVLYGVFLYMGITSLGGVQFIERITILLMPVKYQPDYIFLRHVKLIRVHCFTIIQMTCFAGMWIIKSIKATSIAFPLMLVALMTVRKLLDFVFTQSDLYWLDHLLPDEIRRTKEDELKKKEQRTEMICASGLEVLQVKNDEGGPAQLVAAMQ